MFFKIGLVIVYLGKNIPLLYIFYRKIPAELPVVYNSFVAKKDPPTAEEKKSLKEELINQLVALSTSGFGLVAALAWNEAIQSFVKTYVEKYFPSGAIWTKFIYAGLITIFAVLITYNLSKVAARLGHKKD